MPLTGGRVRAGAETAPSPLNVPLNGRGASGRTAVLLAEPRGAIRSGLARELRALRMEPIPIDLPLLEAGAPALMEGAGWMRPLLIADGEGARRAIRSLRRAGHLNPVLVYQDFRRSERATELLEAGADCVLTLPLRGAELGARIHALLRRAHGHAAPEVRSGPLSVPLDHRPPTVNGVQIPLTEAEGALLRLLALNLDRPVSRDRLYEMLYEASETKPFVRILDRFVCNIRRRIAELSPEGAGLLRTLPGYGYALASAEPDGDARSVLHFQAEPCDMRKR